MQIGDRRCRKGTGGAERRQGVQKENRRYSKRIKRVQREETGDVERG